MARSARHLFVFGVAASVALVGCGGEEKEDDKAGSGPTFNYVPLNRDTCVAPDDDVKRRAVAAKLTQLSTEFEHYAAVDFKLCDSCADNKFLAVLNSVTKPVTLGSGANAATVAPPLADHVNKALAYPFRYLVISHKRDGAGAAEVVLGQGVRTNDDAAKETQPQLEIQMETLNSTCNGWQISTLADVTDGAKQAEDVDFNCAAAFESSVPTSKPFGFIVPASLPDLTGDVAVDAALIDGLPGLDIEIQDAEVSYTIAGAECSGTGTIKGWVSAGSLAALEAAGGDIKGNASADGKVSIALQFSLVPAGVAPGVRADESQISPRVEGGVAPPPAITKGSVTFASLTCTNCKEIGKQPDCGTETEIALAGILIQGPGGTFSVTAEGGEPVLADSQVYGSVVTANGEAKDGKVEYTFDRGFRPGLDLPLKPACVAVLDGAAAAPDVFLASDGWIPFEYRVRTDASVSCVRTLLICQTFSADACGANSKLDVEGNCDCQDGFASANGSCLPISKPCPETSIVTASEDGKSAICGCPVGQVGDGYTCAADPCANNGACTDTETCIVNEETQVAHCEPIPEALPPVASDSPSANPASIVEAAAVAPSDGDGKNDEIGESDDDGDANMEAGLGETTAEDDDEVVAPPPLSAKAKWLAKARAMRAKKARIQKRAFMRNLSFTKYNATKKRMVRHSLPALKTKVGKSQEVAAGAFIKSRRAMKGATVYKVMVPLEQAREMQKLRRAGQLGSGLSFGELALERRPMPGRKKKGSSWHTAHGAQVHGSILKMGFGRTVKVRGPGGGIIPMTTVTVAVAQIPPPALIAPVKAANPTGWQKALKSFGRVKRSLAKRKARVFKRKRWGKPYAKK